MSKGFYFSFDALLALMVMIGSLILVSQSSQIAYDSFRAGTIEFQEAKVEGQDAMRIAAQQNFSFYNESFQDELVEDTIMRENDLERDVLDGISLLWAARNISHAERATDRFFSEYISEEYDFRLDVAGYEDDTVFETDSLGSYPDSVSSTSRLVTGHQVDQPSEGFQARAQAVETVSNQTKVVDIPMMGSGGYTNDLEVERDFYVPANEVHEAELYVSMQWGVSNFDSSNIEVNGVDVIDESDLDYLEEDGKAHYGFGKVDVSDYVEEGWNKFYMEFPNQDSNNDFHAHVQPGKRLEIVYSYDHEAELSRDYEYLVDVTGKAQNTPNPGGVWYNHPVQISDLSKVETAVLELDVRNLEDRRGDDLQVFVNDMRVYEESAPVDEIELDLHGYLSNGTNVVSIYGNVELDGGEIVDFTHQGGLGDGPRIYSDAIDEEGSRLIIEEEDEFSDLEFGVVKLGLTREISAIEESLDEPGNPAFFEESFDKGFEILDSFLNVAQMNSIDTNFSVSSDGSAELVFESPRNYTTASRIAMGEKFVESGETTEFWFEDKCFDGLERNHCDLLPETGIEFEVGVPSHVGYGGMFPNETAAVEDANQRLEDQLGDFAEATDIDDEIISTGDQPYIWGPAELRLVVWNE